MIDWNRVSELKSDFGEDDFLEIVEMFLSEVQEKLDELPNQPVAALHEDFHFLKGSAANLGFRAFQAACSAAEKNPDPSEIPKIQHTFAVSKETFLADVDGASQVA